MKNVKKILMALCAMFLVSCTTTGGQPFQVPVPGGQLVFRQQQQQGGGYNPYQQQQVQQQMAGGQQQSHVWGEKIVTTQKYHTPETRGAGIEIQGTPPAGVCAAVKQAVGYWCQDMNVQHGVWPTFDEACNKAKSEFAKLGYNVERADKPAPNTFNIVQYKMHEEKIGKPAKVGDPTIERSKINMQDVPETILARSRAGEKGIMYEDGKHPGLQQ